MSIGAKESRQERTHRASRLRVAECAQRGRVEVAGESSSSARRGAAM